MERISSICSVTFDFCNLNFSGAAQLENILYAKIEGTLIIKIRENIFFSEEDILLLEFARQLFKWVENSEEDFKYDSMDFEESPILYFRKVFQDKYVIGSIWLAQESDQISIDELRNASKGFIKNIIHVIKENTGLDVTKLVNRD